MHSLTLQIVIYERAFFENKIYFHQFLKKLIAATTYKVTPLPQRKQIQSRGNNRLIVNYSLDTMQGIISIDNNQSTYIRKQALAGHNYEPFIQYFFNLLLLNIIFIQKTRNATKNFQGR